MHREIRTKPVINVKFNKALRKGHFDDKLQSMKQNPPMFKYAKVRDWKKKPKGFKFNQASKDTYISEKADEKSFIPGPGKYNLPKRKVPNTLMSERAPRLNSTTDAEYIGKAHPGFEHCAKIDFKPTSPSYPF
jgi:hypothetical protein